VNRYGPAVADRFDAAYYRRFYGRRPVHDRHRIGQLATAVLALAAWWHLQVRSVLDVGAGKGYWGSWLASSHPRVRYHGIDASPYACRRYGHELADLATWEPAGRYDLVVCQSVLQYLPDRGAQQAIDVLGRAGRGLLFVEVPTLADRTTTIDPAASDMDVHWRTGRWYRSRLSQHFVEVGAGLWLHPDAGVSLFELERAPLTNRP